MPYFAFLAVSAYPCVAELDFLQRKSGILERKMRFVKNNAPDSCVLRFLLDKTAKKR